MSTTLVDIHYRHWLSSLVQYSTYLFLLLVPPNVSSQSLPGEGMVTRMASSSCCGKMKFCSTSSIVSAYITRFRRVSRWGRWACAIPCRFSHSHLHTACTTWNTHSKRMHVSQTAWMADRSASAVVRHDDFRSVDAPAVKGRWMCQQHKHAAVGPVHAPARVYKGHLSAVAPHLVIPSHELSAEGDHRVCLQERHLHVHLPETVVVSSDILVDLVDHLDGADLPKNSLNCSAFSPKYSCSLEHMANCSKCCSLAAATFLRLRFRFFQRVSYLRLG